MTHSEKTIRLSSVILRTVGLIILPISVFCGSATLSLSRTSAVKLSISLDNSHPVAAIQFTLNGSKGVRIQSLHLLGRVRNEDWTLATYNTDDSTLNVVIFWQGTSALEAGTGLIAEAIIEESRDDSFHKVRFTRAIASSPEATKIEVTTIPLEWSSTFNAKQFVLKQNYPNPFNPTTTIPYVLNFSTTVRLSVYDISGREIKRIVEESQEPGEHVAMWNGTDSRGFTVSSGTYILRLRAGNTSEVRKMILTR